MGVPWNSEKDEIQVSFPASTTELTQKRKTGKNELPIIYDTLGPVSVVTLAGEVRYRNACGLRIALDTPLCHKISDSSRPSGKKTYHKNRLCQEAFREKILSIDLHGFGDGSGIGVSATIYGKLEQSSGVTTGLVTAKSRLAKRGLIFPRLDLVEGHIPTKLS